MYARGLSDVIALVDAQNKNVKFGEKQVAAGTNLGDGYSLTKAVLKSLTYALVYCKSYSNAKSSNKLKSFYKDHSNAVDDAIKALEGYQQKKVVPDFSAMKISTLLDKLTKSYEKTAKKKLGLTKSKINSFKGKLNTSDEPRVTYDERAKENDYLRDFSMLEKIKEVKNSGDRLFVIGDAHRHKLAPLIRKEGLDVKKDVEFVQEQQNLDIEALNKDTKPIGKLTQTIVNEIASRILSDLKVIPPRPSEYSREKAGIERIIKPSLTIGDKVTLLKKFGFTLDIVVEGGELSGDVKSEKEMPKIINTEKRGNVTIKLLCNSAEIRKTTLNF